MTRVLDALREHIAAVAAGKVTLASYVSVISGTGILLFLTLDRSYELAHQTIAGLIWINIAYFVFEFAVRIHHSATHHQLRSYLLSGSGFVDWVSAITIPIAVLFGVEPRTAYLLGVIWLLKIAPDIAGFKQLRRVIINEREQLGSVLAIFLLVLYAASVIVHVLERDAQPAAFGTIHGTLWWAIVTLTTTGYGDAVPVTQFGRLVAACVMICGIGVLGMLVGVLATGYATEARRSHLIRTWELVSKVPFFTNLPHGTIVDLTNMLRRLELPPRTTIVRKGAAGDCMYFIASGAVAVELPDRKIPLPQGAFFGELALISGEPRSANVVTTIDTSLLVLDLLDFRTLMARHPELTEVIDAEAKRRVQENRERGAKQANSE